MGTNGFIRLNRGFFINEMWTEPRRFSRAEAWLWLISAAHYKLTPKIVIVRDRKVRVERGQLYTSIRNLATVFGWSKSKVLSVLGQWKGQSMIKIGTVKGTLGTLITLCNFDKYNIVVEVDGTEERTVNAENEDSERDINKEYIEEVLKNTYLPVSTHTVEINEKGVWGKNKIFRIVCNQKTYSATLPQLYERWEVLPRWYAKYAPNLLKVKQQLSLPEFAELVGMYDLYDISRVMADMSNNTTIHRKRNLFLTLRNWLSVDKVRIERETLRKNRDYYKPARIACAERGIMSFHQFLAYEKKLFAEHADTIASGQIPRGIVSSEHHRSEHLSQEETGDVRYKNFCPCGQPAKEGAGGHGAFGIQQSIGDVGPLRRD